MNRPGVQNDEGSNSADNFANLLLESFFQEFIIVSNFMHQQVKILLHSNSLLETMPWHWTGEQQKGSVSH